MKNAQHVFEVAAKGLDVFGISTGCANGGNLSRSLAILSSCSYIALGVLLGSLGTVGCASSATNLKPGSGPTGQGALFGRIEVQNQGEDVTGSCYVGLSDAAEHQKANLSLDKSGWLFTSVNRGPTYVSDLLCTLGDLIRYNASFHTRKLHFDVHGDGTIVYFGHVRVELKSEGSGVVAATLLGGGLGNALASAGEGENGAVQVHDGFDEAKREYRRRYGQQALLAPTLLLAAQPANATPPGPTADAGAHDR